MGSGAVVLLVIACLDLSIALFVCLNDYVGKILMPEDPSYVSRGSKVINMPVANELFRNPSGNSALRFLAKRTKLYSEFQKFNFQSATLQYFGHAPSSVLRQALVVFVQVLNRQQIWKDTDMLGIIGVYRARLESFELLLADSGVDNDNLYVEAVELWRCLSLLSINYEEICRKWYLPTYFALALATPISAT